MPQSGAQLGDEPRRHGDEFGIARRLAAVDEHGRVLEAGPHRVPAPDRSRIDDPGGDSVAVVDLRQGDPCLGEDVLDSRRR